MRIPKLRECLTCKFLRFWISESKVECERKGLVKPKYNCEMWIKYDRSE